MKNGGEIMNNRIKEIRKEQHRTLYGLARDAGVPVRVLAWIESGKAHHVSSKAALSIADALGVSMDYMLCLED